jgi:hypothetical protein
LEIWGQGRQTHAQLEAKVKEHLFPGMEVLLAEALAIMKSKVSQDEFIAAVRCEPALLLHLLHGFRLFHLCPGPCGPLSEGFLTLQTCLFLPSLPFLVNEDVSFDPSKRVSSLPSSRSRWRCHVLTLPNVSLLGFSAPPLELNFSSASLLTVSLCCSVTASDD